MAQIPVYRNVDDQQIEVKILPLQDYHAASKWYVDRLGTVDGNLTSKTLVYGASGPWGTTENTTIYQNKIGSVVTLTIAGIIEEAPGTNNVASITTATTIDAAYRPSFTINQPWFLSDAGSFELGYVTVTTGGIISFNQTDGGDFGGSSGASGFSSGTITYTLTS